MAGVAIAMNNTWMESLLQFGFVLMALRLSHLVYITYVVLAVGWSSPPWGRLGSSRSPFCHFSNLLSSLYFPRPSAPSPIRESWLHCLDNAGAPCPGTFLLVSPLWEEGRDLTQAVLHHESLPGLILHTIDGMQRITSHPASPSLPPLLSEWSYSSVLSSCSGPLSLACHSGTPHEAIFSHLP